MTQSRGRAEELESRHDITPERVCLVGALVRFPYTLALPRFGGRNWTLVSALLLLTPMLSLIVLVQRPSTPLVHAIGGGDRRLGWWQLLLQYEQHLFLLPRLSEGLGTRLERGAAATSG